MTALTRHDCGFAAFQCDPNSCTAPCFTARVIELIERARKAKAREDRKLLVAVFLVVGIASFFTLYAVSALVDRGMENIADYRAAHAPV